MTDAKLEYLTTTMYVGVEAPELWLADPTNSLYNFYTNPNDPRWASFSRVLYHESIHFWQVFSSGYLADNIASDWKRLLEFEKNGRILPPSPKIESFITKSEAAAFSVFNLTECWARYWDVHTRGPHTILSEEGREITSLGPIKRTDPYTGKESYLAAAYDAVMLGPSEASEYSAPYRWMMDFTSGYSAFVAIVFPVLNHLAFGSPNPAINFQKSFETAWRSKPLRKKIEARTSNINIDWIELWMDILKLGFMPIVRERALPSFTPGADVISRGVLGSHPIYSRYLKRLNEMHQTIKGRKGMNELGLTNPDVSAADQKLILFLLNFALNNFWGVFSLPGQPDYRELLGNHLTPPRVVFHNYEWFSPGSGIEKLMQLQGGYEADYKKDIKSLDGRVKKFQTALYAKKIGVSPNQFK